MKIGIDLTSRLAHLVSGMANTFHSYVGGLSEVVDGADSVKLFLTEANRVLYEGYAGGNVGIEITDSNRIGADVNSVDVIYFPFNELCVEQDRVPSVVTIHDLIPVHFPDLFPQSVRDKLRMCCERASCLTTVSEYTKEDIVATFGIDRRKITAVHPDIRDMFKREVAEDTLSEVKTKYQLPDKFLFYPAAARPHKNHAALLDVIDNLPDDISLVLTTGETHFPERFENLRKHATGLKKSGRIKVLGYIEESDFPSFYALARAAVFPSLFEGFGHPVIEAMAMSCPVACSDVTSLPEVAGGAALLFDPRSPRDMTQKIDRILHDEKLRRELVSMGRENVKRFDKSSSARRLLAVYKEAVEAFPLRAAGGKRSAYLDRIKAAYKGGFHRLLRRK